MKTLAPINSAVEYYHHVNLDERGSYSADVRDADDKQIFLILAGDELSDGESSIFEDGFMKHKDDMAGLTDLLISLTLIPAGSRILNQG